MAREYMRPGFAAVTVGFSVEGSARWLDFVKQAFDAREGDVRRGGDGSIGHGEVLIGDSLIEVSEARPQWPAKPCSVHYYVDDTDAVFERAVKAGGTSVIPPADAPYGDRASTLDDPAGNHWFIATRLEGGPIPKGFHSITPYVVTEGADRVIAFMKSAFGAIEHMRVPMPDGTIMHSEHEIDGSIVEMADGKAPWHARPAQLHLYVADADATYARALESGGKSVYAPTDQPYGDRECGVLDPGGNYWFIATFKGSAEEAERPASSSRLQQR